MALATMIRELRAAAAFEDAAPTVLRPMLDLVAEKLAASAWATTGRVVRATAHWRPDDGYQSLAVVDVQPNASSPSAARDKRLPSATAWRWVAERGQAVSIDVEAGTIAAGGETLHVTGAPTFGAREFATSESRVRLLEREVTHFHALPLRDARGRVEGMISIESQCRAAIGRPYVWPACAEPLQLIADVAAPYWSSLPPRPVPPPSFDPQLPVVGASMGSIIELLRVFASQDEPVLISGPTGAGKTRLARWCHAQSEVAAGPFETLDLAAIPEELQLAELFGWRKGAFTGAVRDNPGVIARAKGGTLFIDEIDNLSARAQAGLLHVLEERKYRTLGDEGGERVADVRFIIGTNARLVDAVKERRFREDLYYRINVLPVKVPALRDRPDEIPLWATYMAMRHHAKRAPDGVIRLSKQAENVLLAHAWPGNLRELDNIIRRAYAIAMIAYGGATPREIAIGEDHLRQALAQDGIVERGSVVEAIMNAAQRFVAEAERQAPGSLNLDHADAFKGFVLAVATRKLGGNREDAFRLFGKERLVASRNHQKVLKRELERVEALCEAFGRRDQFPFDDLVTDEARSIPPPPSASGTGEAD